MKLFPRKRKRRGPKRRKSRIPYKYKVAGYLLVVGLMAVGISTRYLMLRDKVEQHGDDTVRILTPGK